MSAHVLFDRKPHIVGSEAHFKAVGELIENVAMAFEIVARDVPHGFVAKKSQK